ncbi:hypothetical protein SAMN04488503_2453 [Humidesulfovibrio mexicanus]|uniref:Uncharacterized protein n=1 Tax=Humidesulfovibrio mexicanus TaxID=147047 RepID=A0A239B7T4_9BACT|nr:hypothetical protein [Humidesulfovibrio mexicanus]SNS03244.1 hypothetical protein SAMN04488503_2453 [Humidesulfovibrio mexicanus]
MSLLIELLDNRQYVYAKTLLECLKITPKMFIDVVNKCEINYYVDSHGNVHGDEISPKKHEFNSSHINDRVKFHTYDLKQAIRKFEVFRDLIPEYGANPDNFDSVQSLRDKLAQVQQENTQLFTELQSLRKKTEKPPRTSSATIAASQNSVQRWKVLAAQMVSIALFCGQQGPKERKRTQIQTIAKKLGEALPKTALEVFWQALPDEHKSNKPGPQRQD